MFQLSRKQFVVVLSLILSIASFSILPCYIFNQSEFNIQRNVINSTSLEKSSLRNQKASDSAGSYIGQLLQDYIDESFVFHTNFYDLESDERYVFAVTKEQDMSDLGNAYFNIDYIDQQTSNEDGIITFSYTPRYIYRSHKSYKYLYGPLSDEARELTWALSDSGTLVLSGNALTEEYIIQSDVPWKDSLNTVNRIIVNEGVKEIVPEACSGMINLSNVELPTTLTKISSNAFLNCTSLKNIAIPKSVTSIEDTAFEGCSQIVIQGFLNSEAERYAKRNNIAFIALDPTQFHLGDTNMDGIVNIRDVTAIQRHIAELEIFSDGQLVVADTNGDGEVDISDATHLQMYLAEFDVVLGNQ